MQVFPALAPAPFMSVRHQLWRGKGEGDSSSPTLVLSGTGREETVKEPLYISVHCVFARVYTIVSVPGR
jgi:hypothetical protein